MIEPILITRPQPRSAIFEPKTFEQRKGPVTLVAITDSKSLSLSSLTNPRMLIPALLTRMSTAPNESSTSADNRFSSSPLVTSMANAAARRPVDTAISSAALRQSSIVRLTTATSAPASANACAMTRPRPFDPPVTRAMWPSNRKSSITFLCEPFGMSIFVHLLRKGRANWQFAQSSPKAASKESRQTASLPYPRAAIFIVSGRRSLRHERLHRKYAGLFKVRDQSCPNLVYPVCPRLLKLERLFCVVRAAPQIFVLESQRLRGAEFRDARQRLRPCLFENRVLEFADARFVASLMRDPVMIGLVWDLQRIARDHFQADVNVAAMFTQRRYDLRHRRDAVAQRALGKFEALVVTPHGHIFQMGGHGVWRELLGDLDRVFEQRQVVSEIHARAQILAA